MSAHVSEDSQVEPAAETGHIGYGHTQLETSARVREWRLMSGSDFEQMDRARTVAVVSCSPLEVHGPHLPVMTDYWESEGLALRAMELLSERFDDIEFVHLPPLYVASDVVPQPGSVMFRHNTVERVIEDLGRSLATQGFKHIWVMSFHGGPRHFVPIEIACDRVSRRHDVSMVSVFSVLLNQLTGGRTDLVDILGHLPSVEREHLSDDSHAGLVETSMMLHLAGKYVKPAFATLDRMTVSMKMAQQGFEPPDPEAGKPSLPKLLLSFRHKLKYYEDETYSGHPAVASAELGADITDTLAGHAADTLASLWTGELSPLDCHSPLWPLRRLFSSDALSWLVHKLADYRTQVF